MGLLRADKPGNHWANPRRLHIRSSGLGPVTVECILRERNTKCACFFIPKITVKLYSVYFKVNKLHVHSSLKGEGRKNNGNQERGKAGRELRP